MIIQILHKNFYNTESRIKGFLSFFLILYSLSLYSQDSIPAAINVSEKNNIEFQENFFKALSEKAIFNYKKAIEYLENCNQLLPNKNSVLFEISKNYFKLGRYDEAFNYIENALSTETNNLWMLEHKVTILKKIANFDEAIIAQKKIALTHPKKKQELVYLYLQNRDLVSAKRTLLELKNEKLLNSRLRRIQDKLNNRKPKAKKVTKNNVNSDLKTVFEKEKTFASLKLLLNQLDATTNTNDLLKYSEQGLTLFPAQPFVYLLNGKALNRNNQFKKALQSLQNGIDFVIDDTKIEAEFYLEMAKTYKKLNNIKKANSYKNKAAKILK